MTEHLGALETEGRAAALSDLDLRPTLEAHFARRAKIELPARTWELSAVTGVEKVIGVSADGSVVTAGRPGARHAQYPSCQRATESGVLLGVVMDQQFVVRDVAGQCHASTVCTAGESFVVG